MKNGKLSFVMVFILFCISPNIFCEILHDMVKPIKPFKTMGIGSKFKYEKFEFERVVKEKGDVKIIMSVNGKPKEEFQGCSGDDLKHTAEINKVEIYKNLINKGDQALIFVSNCGAKNEGALTLVNLERDGTYSVLFNSEKYETKGYYYLADLNQDGSCEIVDCAFSPFNECELLRFDCDSVDPELVFSYDIKTGNFIPSNCKFKKLFLREAKSLSSELDKNNLSSVLNLCSVYWFMGDYKTGWKIFTKYFGANTREVKRVLNGNQYLKNMKCDD